jgi:hypothetical protein
MEAAIRQRLAAAPDVALVDWDARNRIAIVEAPHGSLADLRQLVGDDFLVDLNAPLRF